MYDFPVLYGIKKQNGNANGRLCKERLFRSTIFAVISPALISFSGAPNGLNALPEVRFEFFFNWLIIASLAAVFRMSRNARVTSKKRLRGRLDYGANSNSVH